MKNKRKTGRVRFELHQEREGEGLEGEEEVRGSLEFIKREGKVELVI